MFRCNTKTIKITTPLSFALTTEIKAHAQNIYKTYPQINTDTYRFANLCNVLDTRYTASAEQFVNQLWYITPKYIPSEYIYRLLNIARIKNNRKTINSIIININIVEYYEPSTIGPRKRLVTIHIYRYIHCYYPYISIYTHNNTTPIDMSRD